MGVKAPHWKEGRLVLLSRVVACELTRCELELEAERWCDDETRSYDAAACGDVRKVNKLRDRDS